MKIMMLDGTNLIHRAYYGIRRLTTKDGLNTNALYGFLNTLLRLIDEEKPDGICVALDNEQPTFRREQYSEYKAQRSSMDEELAEQLPVLDELLDTMNIPHLTMPGYEADDILGTLSRIVCENGNEAVVVSGDRDMLQLAGECSRVKYVSTAMGKTTTIDYTPDVFEAEYGFPPINLIDLKALMGDASDNIKGVAGIGKITATDLIRRFKTIDELYGNLENSDIKISVQKKLADGKEDAYFSYGLAKIDRYIPMDLPLESLKTREPNAEVLLELLTKLEFRSQIEKLGLNRSVSVSLLTPQRVREKKTVASIQSVLSVLGDRTAVAIDEGLSRVAVCDGATVFIFDENVLGMREYTSFLNEYSSEKYQKITHDSKALYNALLRQNIPFGVVSFDTQIAAYLADPSTGKYDLEHLAFAYLARELTSDEDALALKAEAIFDLHEPLAQKLESYQMTDLLTSLELPLARVLAEMEFAGMKVSVEQLEKFGEQLSDGIDRAQRRVYELAGGVEFNINSTKILGELLFDTLALPPVKKTKTGYSTDIEVLNKLRDKHPIIGEIIEYRQLSKLKTTYCDGLLKVVGSEGRIHTNFNMTATATGRLSSTEPNLQNIPVRRDLGSEIRKMFIAEDGCVLVDADYSQIELRVLAHIASDRAMSDAFRNGDDIHAITASQVLGDATGSPAELRRRAKAVNFGIVYGISAFSLADGLGITTSEAKRYIENYLEHYSGIRNYMKTVVEKAKEDGFVTTILNRRRYLPELKSSNFNVRSFGERAAMNTPIQGSAADIIKLAMLRVAERLKRDCPQARLVLQVHDELIVEAPAHLAQTVEKILTEEMENVIELSVPLIAEAHSGETWHSAKG